MICIVIYRITQIHLLKYVQKRIIINETFQLSDNLKIGFESVMLSRAFLEEAGAVKPI